ncbi:RNA polymerase sigma factor [Tunicatimonas pelagia]|uniref:RNA polymerase sigma factor n=1 Tax=Tunicatimonas pelagia TaxID=931531 RepID=UPI0026654E5B|nr:sigma-70 family RNA polymerase sigma factor [Tunicatimonas pelagia]WKN45703.1 sigma-70 family RNA polymerase sigma factor [Tunicatimonas pelagia]
MSEYPFRKLHQQEKSPGSDRPDEVIWNDFINGSDVAFTEIYDAYFDSLVRLGQQFNLNNEIIKDAIQDFFIDLRDHRKRLTSIQHIRPYLLKSFRRKLLKVKKRQEKSKSSLADFHHLHFSVTPSREKTMLESEQLEEQAARLNKAIQKLSRHQKEAIYYLYFENMSYQEIQQVMGMKYIRSARNLIYQALNRLRKAYSK